MSGRAETFVRSWFCLEGERGWAVMVVRELYRRLLYPIRLVETEKETTYGTMNPEYSQRLATCILRILD